MERILLASQSPRHSDLLKQAGYHIETFPPKLSEILNKNLSLDEAIISIARQKAEACEEQFAGLLPSEGVLLSADTLVALGEKILGKPENREQAKYFINMLSGCVHEVKTAVFLKNMKTLKSLSYVVTSRVEFKKIKDEEVEAYLDLGEWTDKAGAYGIQGAAGAFVVNLEGSLNNVIGLPVESLAAKLEELR